MHVRRKTAIILPQRLFLSDESSEVMMKRLWKTSCLFALCIPFFIQFANADSQPAVQIDNPSITGQSLHFYFSAHGTAPITQSDVTVSFGGHTLPITKMEHFSDSGEGMSYLLLVDVSGSMKRQVDSEKQFLQTFIDSMGEKDSAAISTVGNDVKNSNFTSDKQALHNEANNLGVTQDNTNLYRGIDDSLVLLRSHQSALSSRRALIVVSDGGEDNSEGITQNEVTSEVQNSHIPVFTYALLSPGANQSQIDQSKTFSSFSRMSAGGIDYAADQGPDAVAADICTACRSGYSIEAGMNGTQLNGQQAYLSIDIKSGGMELKDGYDLRAISNSPASSPSSASPVHKTKQTKKSVQSGFPAIIFKPVVFIPAACVLALIIVVLILLFRQRKRRQTETPVENPQPALDAAVPEEPVLSPEQKADSADATVVPQAQQAVSGLPVQLVLLAGKKKEAYDIVLQDYLIIGRDPAQSGLTFQDEKLSARHCQLTYIDGKLLINDLDSTNGTLVNGVPISGSFRLENGDVVTVGSTGFRVMFQSER